MGLRKYFNVILFTAIACSYIATNNTKADTLLVISDSGGSYGSNDLLVEVFGADLIAENIKSSYRKIYKWINSESTKEQEEEQKSLLRRIVAERINNERLDIFSLMHANGSLVSNVPINDAAKILPVGFLRRFYSTGCSEWGYFELDFKNNPASTTFKRKSSDIYFDYIQELGADEFIIHANNNYTGLISLPYLAKGFRSASSWAAGAIQAFKHVDDTLARYIPTFSAAEAEQLKLLDLLDFGGYGPKYWKSIITSRPVFFIKKEIYSAIPDLKPIYLQTPYDDKVEFMQEPKNSFISMLQKNCDGKLASYTDCEPRKDDEETINDSRLAYEVIKMFTGFFLELSPKHDGCVEPGIFQGVIDRILITPGSQDSPKLSSICMRQYSKDEGGFQLEWQWDKSHPGVSLTEMFNSGEIKSIQLSKKGKIRFVLSNRNVLNIKLTGVGLKLGSVDGRRIPSLFAGIRPRSVKIFPEDGFSLSLSGTLFMPIKMGSNTSFETIDFIKILGINLN
ncbi:MAG: hypothetical protein AABZ06_03220 [Bdellovibrionota bacterium]